MQTHKDKTGNPMETLKDLFAYQGPAVGINAKPMPNADFDAAPIIDKARDVLGGIKLDKTA